MRNLLAAAPRTFGELAATVFPLAPRQEAEAGLGALVALGARVRDAAGTPVLSARYHLFARATEGAFTCLAPEGPHVALARHEICPDCRGAVFEFGSCKRCGAVYLAGIVERDANGERFTSRVVRGDRRSWLLLGEPDQVADEDDETLEEGSVLGADTSSALLCAGCGRLYPPGTQCGCSGASMRAVRRIPVRSGAPRGCLACGARGAGVIRLFESGNEASAAVLYQALPAEPDHANRPGGGRKLRPSTTSTSARTRPCCASRRPN